MFKVFQTHLSTVGIKNKDRENGYVVIHRRKMETERDVERLTGGQTDRKVLD